MAHLEWNGPVQTPPIKSFEAPDGDYTDTTRQFDKWAPEYNNLTIIYKCIFIGIDLISSHTLEFVLNKM